MDADFAELQTPTLSRPERIGLSPAARAIVGQLDTAFHRAVDSAQSVPPPGDEPQPVTRHTKPQSDPRTGVDVHLVMRLLMASHDLQAAAITTESGDTTPDDLVRAARTTRLAAVDLVSAWYGGGDQMRQYAEALLAAAKSP
ncbi:hypothetical protein [Nocardia sp. NPDC052566]|uniref:hypothetical protein n=1 Tax=Nocardia sp. NPDC052566 TaxID=3364330 RepID=UPI0037C69412